MTPAKYSRVSGTVAPFGRPKYVEQPSNKPRGRGLKRILLYALAALYLATWVWGIPAVHTDIARDVVGFYKQARDKRPREVREVHPRLGFGASYAILPLVTVNHFEYQVAGLRGWGGFTVDLWYVTGSVTVFSLCRWIS